MERCLTDVQTWRAQLPIVARGRQLIRVDINCQRKRITAPLTLVLALVKRTVTEEAALANFALIWAIFAFLHQQFRAGYMHFSKSNARRHQPEHGAWTLN
jgi:hypothetical protein